MCLISILATANQETVSTLDALPHLVGMVMVMVVLAVLWGVCAFTAKMIRIFVPEPMAVPGPLSKTAAKPTMARKPAAEEVATVLTTDATAFNYHPLRITVGGKIYDVTVGTMGNDSFSNRTAPAAVVRTTTPTQAPVIAAAPAPNPTDTSESIASATLSPLAGIVQAITATVGASVSQGDPVMTLEAMKMYTSINAASGGTITAIHAKVGDAVEEGQILYSISQSTLPEKS
jgi:biotin carboxyl carrier protein/Na+-transporting methylmalonyl-CoA/oxaloacetate decarboxylase gamma subunit